MEIKENGCERMAKKKTNKVTQQTNRVGRPTVMTNDAIAKLELAYTAGANNTSL